MIQASGNKSAGLLTTVMDFIAKALVLETKLKKLQFHFSSDTPSSINPETFSGLYYKHITIVNDSSSIVNLTSNFWHKFTDSFL